MARATESATESATHDPTPRRIAEARRLGDVAQSPALRAAVAQAAAVVVLIALGPSIVAELRAYVAGALAQAARGGDPSAAAARALDVGARLIAVPLAAACAATLLVGLVQTGGLWVGRGGRASAARAGGAGFGPAAPALGAAVARASFAVAILLAVGAATLAPELPLLSRLASPTGAAAARALGAFGALARQLAVRLVAAALLVGVGDELWARMRHRQRMRMTRRQSERERRELEGDPRRRRERRRLHAEVGAAATAADARRADLVVTSEAGGALAVALGYQPNVGVGVGVGAGVGAGRAPIVVVTGHGAAAARLIGEARAAGVPIFADAPLARALGQLAPGVEIPVATYRPVAEFLRIAGLGRAMVNRSLDRSLDQFDPPPPRV